MRQQRLDIFTEKNYEGAWCLSAIVGAGEFRVSRSYYGYPKREAIALFRQFIREEYGH